MAQTFDLLSFVIDRAVGLWTRPATLATIGGVLLALVTAMLLRRHDLRAVSRGIATDAAYTFFYLSGLYSILIGGRLYGTVNRFVPQLRLGAGLPPFAQIVILLAASDFIAYWWHRLAHAVPALWQFHQIHHSQEHLAPLTNFRFHIVDVIIRSLLTMLPALLLGSAPDVWLTVIVVQTALDGLAHGDLPWTYGPLGSLIVSPQFHRLHHSSDPAHYGRNFGLQYSVWDRVFGTALNEGQAPRAYGIETTLPSGFFGQLVVPFLTLTRRRSRATDIALQRTAAR